MLLLQSCVIDLNKSNVSSRGIYAYANAPLSSANGNSYNTFTDNTIQDSYNGIYLSGNSSFPDLNNSITNNIIQNIGNNLSTAIYPLYFSYQSDVNVLTNTINNVSGASTFYGLYSSSISPEQIALFRVIPSVTWLVLLQVQRCMGYIIPQFHLLLHKFRATLFMVLTISTVFTGCMWVPVQLK